MSDNQDLISAIVPVYKVEEYLEKCVDSVLGQTYKNLEIILVDDGSPDDCPKVCDDYAKKDQRIRVIHKKNGGLSDARNAGLELASGEWVVFVDSDDWVELDYIEKLLTAAQDHNTDIAVCSFNYVYPDGKVEPVLIDEAEKIMDSRQALVDLLTYQKYGKVMTWNKLYKTSLFRENKITFPKGKIHEDNFTTYRTYFYAKKIVYIDQPLYNYLQRSESIMAERFSEKRLDAVEAAEEALEFVKNNLPEITDAAEYNLMMSYMTLINRLHVSELVKKYKKIWSQAMKRLHKMKKRMSKNPFLRFKDKARLNLSVFPNLYRAIDGIFVKAKAIVSKP